MQLGQQTQRGGHRGSARGRGSGRYSVQAPPEVPQSWHWASPHHEHAPVSTQWMATEAHSADTFAPMHHFHHSPPFAADMMYDGAAARPTQWIPPMQHHHSLPLQQPYHFPQQHQLPVVPSHGAKQPVAASRNAAAVAATNQPCAPTVNLFLCYLPISFNDHRLQQLVSQYGLVVSAKVMMDLHTKQSRGFGFALMASVEDAVRARESLDGMSVEGKRLQVRFAAPPANDAPSAVLDAENLEGVTNLYIKGIPLSWRDEKLTQFFSQFGTVLSAVVLMEGRESKGIALVRYGSKEAVGAVLRAAPLHVDGWPQPITVRISRQQQSRLKSEGDNAAVDEAHHEEEKVSPVRQQKPTDPAVPHKAPETAAASLSPKVVDALPPVPNATASPGSKPPAAPAPVPAGPFGLLLRMNNPYGFPRISSSGTLTPADASPQTAAMKDRVLPPLQSSGTNTPPLHPASIRRATMQQANSSGPRSPNQETKRDEAPSSFAGIGMAHAMPIATGHSCHYCQLGTTIRLYNAPTDQSYFERWVDEILSGFGAVLGKEVYHNCTALVTFVEPGAAHMAVQTLMHSDFHPEIFDCSQGLYVG